MKICLRYLAALAIIFAMTGCISTQYFRERRITTNLDAFNSFSAETQGKVRDGQIDIGFSEMMVYIAWGKADQVFTRTTKQGEATVWAYTGTRIKTESEWVSIPVRVVDRDGHSVIRYRRAWIDRNTEEEYTLARVEFIDGIVSAIEQLSQK
ncbi:hypothetical protein SAMN02745165_01332 [Malonomonas rubra DSM 5091]|uniref:Lipoprotein n=1 Tax=Malonomonas rubra DSM 5091 TaxID=1122189 RepID=A0A1M6FLH6_MALRU|nr:hypothetical protein [Malonomonas rubra]SHI98516.1 hypothetical protein SAMN02745165_01332 [Malonomonas rubra DSM 5091]